MENTQKTEVTVTLNAKWVFVALLILAFVAGRLSPRTAYIGQNVEKYRKAEVGVLLTPSREVEEESDR